MPKGKSTWGTLFKRGERTSHEVRQILDAPIDPKVPFSGQLKRIYEALGLAETFFIVSLI